MSLHPGGHSHVISKVHTSAGDGVEAGGGLYLSPLVVLCLTSAISIFFIGDYFLLTNPLF